MLSDKILSNNFPIYHQNVVEDSWNIRLGFPVRSQLEETLLFTINTNNWELPITDYLPYCSE